jgi:hypothetical protein
MRRPDTALDRQRLQVDGAAVAIAELDVNVRRGMVARVHGDTAIRKAMENRHGIQYGVLGTPRQAVSCRACCLSGDSEESGMPLGAV